MKLNRSDISITLILLAAIYLALMLLPAHATSRPSPIKLTSSAFESNQLIPPKYTGMGLDVSPPLTWSNLPIDAKELAVVVDDPDAPSPQPWVHWVIYGIKPEVTQLPEGKTRGEEVPEAAGALAGVNSWGASGYRGPLPPPGSGLHHYRFTLYVLSAPSELAPGASKEQLLEAINDKILAQGTLVGLFERN